MYNSSCSLYLLISFDLFTCDSSHLFSNTTSKSKVCGRRKYKLITNSHTTSQTTYIPAINPKHHAFPIAFLYPLPANQAGYIPCRLFRLLPARHPIPEVLKMGFITASIVACSIHLKPEGMPKLVLGPNLKRMIGELTGGPAKKNREDEEDEENGEGDMGSGPWF
jgi:hypothetical protein